MATTLGYQKTVTFNAVELPLNDMNMNIEAVQIEDSNIVTSSGERTRLVGLTDWSVDGNGHVGAAAGYLTTIKKGGTPVSTSAEATTNVSGKIYQVTDTAKRVIDETVTGESTYDYITVNDDGSPVASSNILSIDTLFGIVTFTSGYSIVGAITLDYDYIPLADVAQAHAFDLSMSADVRNATDYATAAANSGTRVNKIGMIDRQLSLTRFEDIAHTFKTLLLGRTLCLVEISTTNGLLTFRGWFYVSTQGNAGAIDALEDQTIEFVLAGRSVTNFSYSESASLNGGLSALLSNFEARTGQTMQYLPDGATGLSGTALVSELSFSGDIDGVDEFNMALVSGGALSEV